MTQDFLPAYEDHVFDVYGFFAYRAVPVADAEDLTQLTFERALRAWDRFDPSRASARTWLLAIARNAYIDYRRRDPRRREAPLPSDDADTPALASASDPPPRHGLDPALETAMAGLSRREREVVALRFGGDLRGPEIAQLLGISLANAQQILSRALRKLRRELERDQRQGPPDGEAAARGGS